METQFALIALCLVLFLLLGAAVQRILELERKLQRTERDVIYYHTLWYKALDDMMELPWADKKKEEQDGK